ncbi:MAG: hypothetical protein CSA29_04340 [Desulfobacterales bacterium]|nr:MAG: hypothetical protein CSA29_04340 [Desulfobacterales bacterium]
MSAAEKYQAQQIIFAPDGDVQETAAAKCLLINNSTFGFKNVQLSYDVLPNRIAGKLFPHQH